VGKKTDEDRSYRRKMKKKTNILNTHTHTQEMISHHIKSTTMVVDSLAMSLQERR
jgi:hypothetical protein